MGLTQGLRVSFTIQKMAALFCSLKGLYLLICVCVNRRIFCLILGGFDEDILGKESLSDTPFSFLSILVSTLIAEYKERGGFLQLNIASFILTKKES